MDDLISRQVAIDALRDMQTYKLFAGDDQLLIDQAGAQTELMMLPSAQPEQMWIPCSERLPDGRLNKSYLVQDKDGRRAVGTYTNWGWVFGHYMNDPVAWMPLPEPWKEKPNEIH